MSMRRKGTFIIKAAAAILAALSVISCPAVTPAVNADGEDSAGEKENQNDYIKWIDFDVTAEAMEDAADADIASYGTERHTDWITLLSLLGARYGGDFSRYKKSDLDGFAAKLADGEAPEKITSNPKLYRYYSEAYGAILGGLLGKYTKTETDESGAVTVTEGYGVRAFSPFARGYYYSDFDDFGVSRSFGYKRHHLGHDMMGSVGTPIVAVESGYVEALGWNMYGGWRVGIRSFDGKRYYYYAHLRKNHPYAELYEGKTVNAGEVIGYLGMTGYSSRENVNNITTPHLHWGLEIIFDSSQKDGWNQIWIDMYELTKFLSGRRASVRLDEEKNERVTRVYYTYDDAPD